MRSTLKKNIKTICSPKSIIQRKLLSIWKAFTNVDFLFFVIKKLKILNKLQCWIEYWIITHDHFNGSFTNVCYPWIKMSNYTKQCFWILSTFIWFIYIYSDPNHICNICPHILTKVTCEPPCMLERELEMSKNNNLDSKWQHLFCKVIWCQ
jgi:hypothetical protein